MSNKAILAKNPNLEPNTKYIGWRVAELWPFELVHTLAGERTPDTGRDFIFCPMLLCSA